jgi:DNA-binding response OmpR family regulator
MKLLLVEDNLDLAENVSQYLTKEGHLCEVVHSIREAENKLAAFQYDILLLDLMLPDGSGMEVLRRMVRNNQTNMGVIIISAKNALGDKVEGLDLGADDYLTKPFHLSELNARIKSIYRRRHFEGKQTIEFNEIKIDPDTQEVFVNEELIILTRKEYELLVYLIANKNRVLTKQTIAEHLWGDHVDFMDSFDFVYQHIKNLRKKLTAAGAQDYLTNVYGMGYRFKEHTS